MLKIVQWVKVMNEIIEIEDERLRPACLSKLVGCWIIVSFVHPDSVFDSFPEIRVCNETYFLRSLTMPGLGTTRRAGLLAASSRLLPHCLA